MPIDSIESAKAWYAQNGHGKGKRKLESGSFPPGGIPATPVGPIDVSQVGKLPDQGTLNRLLTAARIKVTDLEGRQAQMDAELRDGKLLRAEDVTRQVATACMAQRDRLMQLPTELAIRLAAMAEPAEVADMLRKALKSAIGDWFSTLRIEGGP